MPADDGDELLSQRLGRLLDKRAAPKTICPSEVPRSFTIAELKQLEVNEWRDLMPRVRELIWTLRQNGKVEIMQKGEICEAKALEDIQGPIRARKVVR